MNILITNQHSFNVGDDAAGVALINQIEETFSDAIIHIIYNSSKKTVYLPLFKNNVIHHDIYFSKDDIKHMLSYSIRHIFRLKIDINNLSNVGRYLEVVNQSDIIFFSPAGANIGKYKRWASLFRVLLPTLEGKKVIFALNTIGKSGNVIFDFIAKFVLKRNTIFVRERNSLNELTAMNIPAFQGVDTAFSLQKVNSKPLIEEDYVIFIPTEINRWFENYKRKDINDYIFGDVVPSLAKFLKEKNLKIVLLPHLTDYRGWFEKDYFNRISNNLKSEGINNENIVIYSQIGSFSDYDNLVSYSILTISMRYHGVVLSAKNATPFISLAYENKMKEVCQYTEQMDSYIEVLKHEKYNFSEKLTNIYANRENIIRSLKSKNDFLRFHSKLPVMKAYMDYIYHKNTNSEIL